jgi:hypothetical protein
VSDLPLATPDGRYIIVRGRLWRAANPMLAPDHRQELVDRLMKARRSVRTALSSGDPEGLRSARASVQRAKEELGERGPVWWTDGARDLNRHMVVNTPYAHWWNSLAGTGGSS